MKQSSRLVSVLMAAVLFILLVVTLSFSALAAPEEDVVRTAERLFAVPGSDDLCAVTISGENTRIYKLKPGSGEPVQELNLAWACDGSYAQDGTLFVTRHEMAFDEGSNTFVSALTVQPVAMKDFALGTAFSLPNVNTGGERVAFTAHGIVLIDNHASGTLNFYDPAGVFQGKLQTAYENLKMESVSGDNLYLSTPEAPHLLHLALTPGPDGLPEAPPALIEGPQSPVAGAFGSLLAAANGVYALHPAEGSAVKQLDLSARKAAQSDACLHLLSADGLHTFERDTLRLVRTEVSEGTVLALCGTRSGIYVLREEGGSRILDFLADEDAGASEPEALTGEMYISPTKAEQKSVYSSLTKALPEHEETLFSDRPSIQSPFTTGRIDSAALGQAAGQLSFCRSMAGLTPLTADANASAALQYGAVLLASNPSVLYNGRKPAGMGDAFFDNGMQTLYTSAALFLPESQPLDALVSTLFSSASEDTLLTLFAPDTRAFGLGLAPGEGELYALLSFAGQGEAAFERQFYTWPSAGDFPVEFASGLSRWIVRLDPDALRARPDEVSVTVTGAKGTWTAGATVEDNVLCMTPPEAVAQGDEYVIYIEGLERPSGRPVTLTLNYRFFKLIEIFPDSMTLYKKETTGEGPVLTPLTTDLTMKVGERFQMVCYLLPKNTTETSISYTSNHPDIVRVTTTGEMTACAAGEALLTVTAAGGLVQNVPVTVTEEKQPNPNPTVAAIESDVYTIDHAQGYLYLTPPAETAARLRGNLRFTGDLAIRKPGGNPVTGTVGTGCMVELSREGKIVEILTIILFGDVTGEGSVNTRDALAMRRHVIKEMLLQGPFLLAADTNHDLRISSLDILLVTRYHLYREPVPSG